MENIHFIPLPERNDLTAAYAIASGSLLKKTLMPHLFFQEFLMRNREFFYLALVAVTRSALNSHMYFFNTNKHVYCIDIQATSFTL